MFVSYVLKRWIWIQGLERGRLEEDRLQYDGRVNASLFLHDVERSLVVEKRKPRGVIPAVFELQKPLYKNRRNDEVIEPITSSLRQGLDFKLCYGVFVGSSSLCPLLCILQVERNAKCANSDPFQEGTSSK